MPELNIPGISCIECPSCGHTLADFGAPELVHGLTQVTGRCRHCRTEQLVEIDHWRGETSVRAVSHAPWAGPPA